MGIEWLTLAWKYRNEIAIGIIILVLGLTLLYIKHVFNERDELKQDVVKLQEELVAVKKQVTLNEDIAHAISKIKVQSNNYVSVVETSTSPPVDKPSTLINAGVFQPMSTVRKTVFTNNSSTNNERGSASP